ncbi:MAG: WecB/TagA/CpsF family glycosyltransferase [Eubacteriales bacterium]|nr:WecB/TagA/CpsF family glycosyltransferase [Eubacteriales bacterium]
MSKVSIMGVNFDAISKAEAVERAMQLLREQRKGYVVTPNSEIVYMAKDDPELIGLLNGASLALPDGVGILHAAKILGKPIYEKVAGVEFAVDLLAEMAKENRSLYLLGAKPGVARKAAENLVKRFPGLKISGCHDGYFTEEQDVVDTINASGHTDVVFVCLGAPKQERFIHQHMQEINATLFCGLGGSLDIYAGTAQRAPKFYVDHGLEWLYRLKQEPWRAKRMSKLPLFLLRAMKCKVTGKETP